MCNNDVYNKLGIWVGGYVVNSLEERVDRWGLREGKGSPGEALAAHRFREYIVRGIREGFRVGFDYGRSCSGAARNMASARTHAHVVRLKSVRRAGCLDLSTQANCPCYGAIPKNTPGKWRLIVNLSAPEGASVNDGINERVSSLSYVTVDDAAREVLRRGARSLLAKVDVESAYRAVSVHPDDRWLLGMQWDGGVFVDTALPLWPPVGSENL